MGQTFHILTVIDGQIELRGQGWRQTFARYASAIIPANSGPYELIPVGTTRVLKASVE